MLAGLSLKFPNMKGIEMCLNSANIRKQLIRAERRFPLSVLNDVAAQTPLFDFAGEFCLFTQQFGKLFCTGRFNLELDNKRDCHGEAPVEESLQFTAEFAYLAIRGGVS